MILFPPAKINLGLNVLGKRDDGYHEIISCMYPIPLRDILEVLPATSFSFRQTGLTIEGKDSDNLVVRAWKLMQRKYNISDVYIHLHKLIPMGAGLGGGSADATYTLLALDKLFELNLSVEVLQELSAELGSDCAFFVLDEPQLATGRGEVLRPIEVNLDGYYLKVINPGVHISTTEAYQGVQFGGGEHLQAVLSKSPEHWKNKLTNGFESNIFHNHAIIGALKARLYDEGAVYASMTGSGSTLFGIFKDRPDLTQSDYFERVYQL